MKARGFQLGYAEAMYRNGSLNFPIGMGRTITECELMRKYKTPLYVSARREMLEQTAKIAKELGVEIRSHNQIFAI